jgi:hypothetical protein
MVPMSGFAMRTAAQRYKQCARCRQRSAANHAQRRTRAAEDVEGVAMTLDAMGRSETGGENSDVSASRSCHVFEG